MSEAPYTARVVASGSLADLTAALARVAVPRAAVDQPEMRAIQLHNLPPDLTRALAAALAAHGACLLSEPTRQDPDALLLASPLQLTLTLSSFQAQTDPTLHALARTIAAAITGADDRRSGALRLGSHELIWGQRTYVMGIINITPDSFSADGLIQPGQDVIAAALMQARQQANDQADLLDIGGASSRPGAQPISAGEEYQRVIPVIQALAGAIDVPLSVDTCDATVAAAALDAGAGLINDIWGLRTPDGGWNEALADLVARRGVPIVLMHNRRAMAAMDGHGGHYPAVHYHDLPGEIALELRQSIAYARSRGISDDRLILDPGIGFGKTPTQNLQLLRQLHVLCALGLPLLLGTSRKSFIGKTLDLPPRDRDEGTAATTALAIQAGVDIVRVHNVQMNVRAARTADAIVRPGRGSA